MKSIWNKSRHSITAFAIILLLNIVFFFFPVTEKLELSAYDWRLAHLRENKLADNIWAVMIDQESLDQYGSFPWDRKLYVDFISMLKDNPPKVFVLDILFQESRTGDDNFAEAIQEADFPVVLPYSFSRVAFDESRLVPVVEPLQTAASALGFLELKEDPDKVVRRAQLALGHEGKLYPSLNLSVFALMQGVDPDEILYRHKKIIVGDIEIPTEEDYSILIDYYLPKGDAKQSFPARSFARYLDPDSQNPDLNGITLLLGPGARGLMDDYQVPNQPKMYGVLIHANILNTLVNGSYIRTTTPLKNLIIVLILSIIFGIFLSRTSNVKKLSLISTLILFAALALNLYLFKLGYWYYLVQPCIVIFSGMLVISTMQFFRTHKLFGQFVAKEVVDKMLESDKFSEMGGVEKEVSILFSDIRGYTTLSEKISPTEVMNMLNEYHAEMVAIFHKHYGRVFDYQGDAQMVVFGAPIEREDHALCACRAALDMNVALDKLRKKWSLENKELFEIGVGICTGVVAVGMVGAEGAKQYSAIGDSTNVAARLQGQSKVLGAPIIISPITMEYVKELLLVKSLGEVDLKGKSKPMKVFTVIGEKYLQRNKT